MSKTVFIVEDKDKLRQEVTEFFMGKDWRVFQAENGKIALELLEKEKDLIDLIILDMKMPVMDGLEFLQILNRDSLFDKPIIVLSAFLDEYRARCTNLGIKCILKKPIDFNDLLLISESVLNKSLHSLTKPGLLSKDYKYYSNNKDYLFVYNFDDSNKNDFNKPEELKEVNKEEFKLSEIVQQSEARIEEEFKKMVEIEYNIKTNEPLLFVGRRWNSWYPSFFEVDGGAYAIIGPEKQNKNNNLSDRPVTIVDPGYKFLKIMKEYNISVKQMHSCIVSHNHPDHLAGIFEYINCRHTLGIETKYYTNPTAAEMFKDYLSGELNVINTKFNLMNYKTRANELFKLDFHGFTTHHQEIGRISNSLGLTFLSKTGDNPAKKCVILGDTEFDITSKEHNKFIEEIVSSNLSLLVLHIGSSQEKQKERKHLYIPGLKSLLLAIEVELMKLEEFKNRRLTVLISEWGLEHATREQLTAISDDLGKSCKNDENIMKYLIQEIQKRLEKIVLLPADIGLTVGIESGMVYLEEGVVLNPQNVNIKTNKKGIEYSEK